ncbi:MAG: hypothetical protein EHM70_24470 [Chloroflexota bacterium]|nr:MAG: hypothetical protein EHM70_24470 [Chloroflexota bacterium]
MWVQLTSIQYLREKGIQVTRRPGDWVDVGKQRALQWISRGGAGLPERTKYGEFDMAACSGVLILATEPETPEAPHPARKILEPFEHTLEIQAGARCLLWQRNLLWDPGVKLRLELVAVGFALLETWQIAVPLCDYQLLASQVGSDDDRERTKAVTHDLRIPLYDTRLMFVKACRESELLFERWEQELNYGGDERLAFVRALYRTPMLVLALPITWTNQDVR